MANIIKLEQDAQKLAAFEIAQLHAAAHTKPGAPEHVCIENILSSMACIISDHTIDLDEAQKVALEAGNRMHKNYAAIEDTLDDLASIYAKTILPGSDSVAPEANRSFHQTTLSAKEHMQQLGHMITKIDKDLRSLQAACHTLGLQPPENIVIYAPQKDGDLAQDNGQLFSRINPRPRNDH